MVSNCSDQSQSHQSGPNLPLRIMVMPRSNRSDVVSVSEPKGMPTAEVSGSTMMWTSDADCNAVENPISFPVYPKNLWWWADLSYFTAPNLMGSCDPIRVFHGLIVLIFQRRGGPGLPHKERLCFAKASPLFLLTSDRMRVVRVSSAPVAIRVGVFSLVIPSHIMNIALLIHGIEWGLIFGGKAYAMASQILRPPHFRTFLQICFFSLLYRFSFSLQWFG